MCLRNVYTEFLCLRAALSIEEKSSMEFWFSLLISNRSFKKRNQTENNVSDGNLGAESLKEMY